MTRILRTALPVFVATLLVWAGLAIRSGLVTAAGARALPLPAMDAPPGQATSAVVVLAGGCFWGVQGVFQHVRGVTGAVSGYAGGDKKTAEYDIVTTGRTGHAESVQVTFDPHLISFRDLLDVFFTIHDPTTLNRQGNDMGTQYRSAIFYTNDAQRETAEAVKAAAGVFGARPATSEGPGRPS